MQIRQLDPQADRAALRQFFDAIADYVLIERGTPPDAALIDEFLTEAPPGCDPAASSRLGLFDGGKLIAVAEMAIGFPGPTDAYLGFLAVAAPARGRGAGVHLLQHLQEIARARGAAQMFLAVLDANPRARAFWERQGFRLALANREVTLGTKTHIAHRLGKPL